MFEMLGRHTQERDTHVRRVFEYEAALKGDAVTEKEKSAGSSGLTEDMRTTRTDVKEMDLRRCNGCAEPFDTRRAPRQDHGKSYSGRECDLVFVNTQTNRSWIYVCETCQRHLCAEYHAKEIGKAPVTRATGPTATSSVAASRPPEPQTSTSHEHLLHLLSKIDALPGLQTVLWIPRELDRRCATIRLQALNRAMQAAKANTAAPTQKLWSKMALITPLLILRVAPGHKQQEEERGSIRDEIRKRLALAEKGDLEQLWRGLIEDQEKQKQQERRSECPGSTDAESDRLLRAAQAADRTTADSSQTTQRLQTSSANGGNG